MNFLVYDLNMYNLHLLIIPLVYIYLPENYVNFPPVNSIFYKQISAQLCFCLYSICAEIFVFLDRKKNHLMKLQNLEY